MSRLYGERFKRDFVAVGFGDGFAAMFTLANHPGVPALAWPAPVRQSIPGPSLYWLVTGIVGLAEVAAVVWLSVRVFALRVGSVRRDRLGVNPNARLARRRDLRTIAVKGPIWGRSTLGSTGNSWPPRTDGTHPRGNELVGEWQPAKVTARRWQ